MVNCPALLFNALNKPSNLGTFVIDRILLKVFHFRVFTLILNALRQLPSSDAVILNAVSVIDTSMSSIFSTQSLLL